MATLTTYLHDALQCTQPPSLNEQHTCNCPLKTRHGNCVNYANYEIITAFENTRIATCKTHLKANLHKLEFPGLAKVFYRHQPSNRQILSPISNYFYPNLQTFEAKMILKLTRIEEEWGVVSLYNRIIQPIFETNRQILVEEEQRRRERYMQQRHTNVSNIQPPIVYMQKIKNPDVLKDADCSICFEALTIEDTAKLKVCSHMFHMMCVKNMLKYKINNCPLCRCCMIGKPQQHDV